MTKCVNLDYIQYRVISLSLGGLRLSSEDAEINVRFTKELRCNFVYYVICLWRFFKEDDPDVHYKNETWMVGVTHGTFGTEFDKFKQFYIISGAVCSYILYQDGDGEFMKRIY